MMLVSKMICSNVSRILPHSNYNVIKTVVRSGGGGPRMMRYRTTRNVDIWISLRYFFYGLASSCSIIAFCNLFIGKAKLYDYDPELYQPEYYEFFSHPIQRFWAKYVKQDPKISYYRRLAKIERSHQVYSQESVIRQAYQLQILRNQGWYLWNDRPAVENPSDYKTVQEYSKKHGL